MIEWCLFVEGLCISYLSAKKSEDIRINILYRFEDLPVLTMISIIKWAKCANWSANCNSYLNYINNNINIICVWQKPHQANDNVAVTDSGGGGGQGVASNPLCPPPPPF